MDAVLYISMVVFLAIGTAVVYRRQRWRLAEFMFVLIAASIVPSRKLSAMVQFDMKPEAIALTILPLALGCFGLAIAGGAIGMRYINDLRIEATVPRLLLMVFGILIAVSIPGVLVSAVVLIGATLQIGDSDGNDFRLALLVACGSAIVAGCLWQIRETLREHIPQ
jgi:hypothetical protein